MFDTLLPLANTWPDALDRATIVAYLTLVLVLPAIGYLFAIADFRSYLRAMRGVLIVVRQGAPRMPAWVRLETPSCLRALGLTAGCSETEVKRAYRRQAELLHPDRGGDRRRFMRLQDEFEMALEFVRERRVEPCRST